MGAEHLPGLGQPALPVEPAAHAQQMAVEHIGGAHLLDYQYHGIGPLPIHILQSPVVLQAHLHVHHLQLVGQHEVWKLRPQGGQQLLASRPERLRRDEGLPLLPDAFLPRLRGSGGHLPRQGPLRRRPGVRRGLAQASGHPQVPVFVHPAAGLGDALAAQGVHPPGAHVEAHLPDGLLVQFLDHLLPLLTARSWRSPARRVRRRTPAGGTAPSCRSRRTRSWSPLLDRTGRR